jgi:DNA polymerase alpha subunit A
VPFRSSSSQDKEEVARSNGRFAFSLNYLDYYSNVWHDQQEGDSTLYDEVADNVYKSIVKGRLEQDDFVEDDGVDGYADNGMDDFGEPMQDSEDEKEINSTFLKSTGHSGGVLNQYTGRKKSNARAAKSKSKPPPEPAPISAYRPVKSEVNDSDFLDSLLGSMKAPVPKPINPRKRKSSPGRRQTDFSSFRESQGASSDGPDDYPETTFSKRRDAFSSDDEALPTPAKRFKTENGAGINVMHTISKVGSMRMEDPYDEFEDDFTPIDLDMDVGDPVKKEESPVGLSGSIPTAVRVKPEPTDPKLEKDARTGPPSWLSMHAALPVSNEAVGGGPGNLVSTRVQALEDDGTLRMFWLDYLELHGKVYLVGKVLDKAIDRYVSACLTIENLERNLFVLPRDVRLEDDYETDIQPSRSDVQRDFEEARREFKIGRCGMKWVKRKYAFGEPGVPSEETEWMKVVYPFSGMLHFILVRDCIQLRCRTGHTVRHHQPKYSPRLWDNYQRLRVVRA